MQERQHEPTAVTVSRLMLDPYRCGVDAQSTLSEAGTGAQWGDEDWRVPPQSRAGDAWPAPDPGRRSPLLAPADRRRLELHAALIRAGVAPAPGDLYAVETLSVLDDTVNDAVRRWIAVP